MQASARIHLRRVQEEPAAGDGRRVLVDGVWPRGVAKEDAALDEWLREVAPSRDLRRWFGHDPAKFEEFRRRYHEELRDERRAAAMEQLLRWARTGRVTLLTATRDVSHSHAWALCAELRHRFSDTGKTEPSEGEGA